MTALRSTPCIACGATIRRTHSSWGSCKPCSERVTGYLRATVGTRDPSAWVRACNQVFGDRAAFVAAATQAA